MKDKYPGLGKGREKMEEGKGRGHRYDPKKKYGKDGKEIKGEPKDMDDSNVEDGDDGEEGGRESSPSKAGKSEKSAKGKSAGKRNQPVLRDQERSGETPPAIPGQHPYPPNGLNQLAPGGLNPEMEAGIRAPRAASPHLNGAPAPGATGSNFVPSGHPNQNISPEQAQRIAHALRGGKGGSGGSMPRSHLPK